MTEKEIGDVLFILRAGLPGAYLNLTPADTAAMVALWHEMFRDSPAGLVAAAAKTYIWRSDNGRFPTPGILRREMEQIQRVVDQCAYGSTLQEYMGGAAADKFPPAVRDFINAAAAEKYEQRTGRIFTSQAQKLEAHKMQLTAGQGGIAQ